MNIQKLKQNISEFRVKMILADYIAILGNSESKEDDIIAFIADENLFEKILNEEDYELKANNIYELITMKKIKVYADPRKDKIFNILDSNIIVNREIPIQYLDIIKELIYTKIVLQKLKNDSLLNKEAKKIIQDQEAIVFLRLYFYLTESTEIAELPKIKEIKDSNIVVDTVYKILIKAYDILRELNVDQPKDLLSIVLRLKELLMSPEQVNININPRILGLLKIPTQLKNLKEEKKMLEYDIEIIEEKLEYKKSMETIPGELKNDPEARELLKKLEDKKERLKEIENEIKELREEWERLRSNKEN